MDLNHTHSSHRPDREILIARDGNHYRLLHGQLRIAANLYSDNEIAVEVKDEGMVRVVKGCEGLHVVRGNKRYPLLRDE